MRPFCMDAPQKIGQDTKDEPEQILTHYISRFMSFASWIGRISIIGNFGAQRDYQPLRLLQMQLGPFQSMNLIQIPC